MAVLSTARRGGDIRLRAITIERRLISLGARDFTAPPAAVGRVGLPVPYAPHHAGFQRQVASALVAARLEDLGGTGGDEKQRRRLGETSAAASHRVAACPDIRSHLRSLDRAERLQRDIERLQRRVAGRTESLARQFDRVLRLLEARGYVKGWALTEAGERLAHLYHEADLLVAECSRRGLLDGLSPPELAGLVSVFTYEARVSEPAPWFATGQLRQRWSDIDRLAGELNGAEDAASLPLTRRPDPGFSGLAHAWASGEDLAQVIEDGEMSGGDFVRNVKQLIDLLRQLGDHVTDQSTAAAARSAVSQLFRGAVAASSSVGG